MQIAVYFFGIRLFLWNFVGGILKHKRVWIKNSGNDDVVMSILNTLLPVHRKVTHIQCLPTEYQGPTLAGKEFRYDFMCTGQDGATFIVEVERQDDSYWFKRCVSYAARAYDKHNKKGHNYDVQPVYLIGLMGIDVPHPDPELLGDCYITEYTFREKNCHDLLDETIFIIFAELVSFARRLEECITTQDRMIYLLKMWDGSRIVLISLSDYDTDSILARFL